MPGPYGSVANPVVLDPYRRIVEVHWPSRWIAARLNVDLAVAIGGENGPGSGPDYVDPFTFASVTDATYSYPDGNPLDSHNGFSSAWAGIDADDITPSGEPSLPGPYAYSLWMWQGIDGFGLRQPYLRYATATEGDELEQTVPGHDDQHFTDGFEANIVLRAQGFVPGGPYDDPHPGTGPKWATGDTVGGDANMQDAETASLSVSGMTLDVAGKAYVAIGSKVIPAETAFDEGEFWVLFARETVTT